MCWSHCHRAYSKQLKRVKDVARRKSIDEDIQSLQWMVSGEEDFAVVLELLKRKHVEASLGTDSATAVTEFFTYFFTQWGPQSHAHRYI